MENRQPAPIPEEISIVQLEDIARRGHMDYLILGGLLKTELPDDVKERFRQSMVRSTMKTLTQVCCLKKMEERFEELGIRHMVLKGAVLKSIYPSPEMREMSDIDAMIYGESLERAGKVMEEMGFTLKSSVKHHDIYIKAPFMVVELHWAMYDESVDKKQHEYFQDETRTLVKENCKYAKVLTPEAFYVYMVAHMAKHFYENGCGIRNLLDVYVYRKEFAGKLDEKALKKELEVCGLTSFEANMRKLADVWMEGGDEDSFQETLFAYMVDCGIYGKGENGIWSQFAKQNEKKQADDQKNIKKWYYFPPLSYMEEYYPWLSKHPGLLWWAWILRAVHGFFSKEGKSKRKMLMDIEQDKIDTMKEMYETLQLNFSRQ